MKNSQLEMDKKNMLNMILLAGIGIAMGIAIMVYVYQKKLLRKERLLQRKEEEINQNTIKTSNPQLSSSASFLRLNVLSSLN